MQRCCDRRDGIDALAQELGCPDGASGWSLHSVPLALAAWFLHRDDATACMTALLRCGGDTDTMGAIAGALLGADRSVAAFPPAWITGIADWPLSTAVLRRTGATLATGACTPCRWWWPLQPIRNTIFLAIILGHGFRRLIP
jgi:ADP-ribosylglycohydrolase